MGIAICHRQNLEASLGIPISPTKSRRKTALSEGTPLDLQLPHRTRSSAVAKIPHDASCLSVVSFVASIVQYLKRSFLLLVTSASDLLVHTIRFCSAVFGVMSSLAVIHTIYSDCV